MTAGGGILHIEKPPEQLVVAGGLFHGIQLWVNLPRAQKLIEPRYQDLRANSVALLTSTDGGALVRVIAGSVGEHHGPGSTYTPMTLLHVTLAPTAQLTLPWQQEFNALGYVLSGSGSAGAEKAAIQTGQLAVFDRTGDAVTVAAGNETLEILLLGGRPIREPVAWGGPFVMNTKLEIYQAFEDFHAGRLGTIPAQRS
jgi:redox-sensitive bicupin YhaK (pirin superfamily)